MKKQALFLVTILAGLGLLIWGTYLAFYVAPLEMKMGFVQKIFYYHVPAAWVMFIAVIICAVASIVFLVGHQESADRAAGAAGELAALFGVMVLVTGPLWAWKAWGHPWVWDVRLTMTLLLEMVLFAYLLVRAFGGTSARSLSAGIAIFGVVQVPLIYFAVDIWRGTHPPRITTEKNGLAPGMGEALLVCAFAFLLIFLALYYARLAIARSRARVDELHLLAEEAGLEEP